MELVRLGMKQPTMPTTRTTSPARLVFSDSSPSPCNARVSAQCYPVNFHLAVEHLPDAARNNAD